MHELGSVAAPTHEENKTVIFSPLRFRSHWLFAMKDTLAENVARALALIVAHPFAEKRVREEMGQADLASAPSIHGLTYLEACIQEAMRLWPTTPLLVRETVVADVLRDTVIPPATQVLILNSLNHRDDEALASADTFTPDRWQPGRIDFRFNHFSNGPQVCAGKDLALFVAKAVVATLLGESRYALVRPALDPSKPLPHAYNYYRLMLSRAARA
jgi:cytochrome P450